LTRELEQLTKTYKAGIINEKEFNKGKERIESKLSQIEEEVQKDIEGKKIIKEILESDDDDVFKEPKKAPEKPEPVKPKEPEKPKELEKPKPVKPKIKPVIKPKVIKKTVKKKIKKKDDDDSTFSKVIIFAGIVCILLLLVLVKVFTEDNGEPVEKDLGGVSGSIDVAVFLDFSCKYSEESWNTMLDLKKVYGDAISIKVSHFPMSVDAIAVENAIQCARSQEMHMDYIDRVFENQGNLDVNILKNLGWAVGVEDLAAFQDCIDSQMFKDRIRDNVQDGLDLGVRQSPTFFVGDETIIGAQTEDYFASVIDQQLGLN